MTIRKTARFTVDPAQIDTALEAIRMFVAHTATEPGTLLYESWRQDNRFLHLMAFADEAAEKTHQSSEVVHAFVDVLYPACTEKPVFQDWEIIDPVRRA